MPSLTKKNHRLTQTELMSVLISRPNDYFRTVTDPSHDMYLHDTQINAARKIIMRLGSNTTRSNHVILVAKMQSGKNGVCNAVVNVLNKSKLYRNLAI